MALIFPDILRSSVTDVMFLMMLFAMARPRYRIWTIIVPSAIVIAANVALNTTVYLQQDYTTLIYISTFIMIPWIIAMKPLIEDSIIQWCFDVVTAANMLVIVMFVSYQCAQLTPIPRYTNTLFRVILFAMAIVIFRISLKPLYLRALEHWSNYLFATLGLFACFVYIYGFTGGVEQALQSESVLLGLLSLTTVFVYLSILLSLQSISRTYELHEAAALAEARREALHAELKAEEAFIEAARRSRHDQRHHDATLLEYLENGSIDQAIEYLHTTTASIPIQTTQRFCENIVANMMLRITARRCEAAGVSFTCKADIPESIPLSSTETSDLLGNLLENALEACSLISDTGKTIVFKTDVANELLRIEERNTLLHPIEFVDGMPVSTKTSEGGIGTRSMRAIVEQTGGMVRFSVENDEFIVQIVIPL